MTWFSVLGPALQEGFTVIVTEWSSEKGIEDSVIVWPRVGQALLVLVVHPMETNSYTSLFYIHKC